MAMFQMGMDTTATARIADELVQQGRECETARLEAGRAIQRLVTQWGGRDFEEARREWRQNDTALREAAAHLSKMGETLRRNVQAQTQSSEADADGTAGGDGSSDKRDLPPGSKTGDYDSEGPRNLDPKVTEAWNKMSRPEQEQWMRNYARELGRKYGLPDFKVTFNQSNNYGSWDPNNRVLNVNPAYFNDPRETIDTVAHEMRHAMQQQYYEDARKHDEMASSWIGRIMLMFNDPYDHPDIPIDEARQWDREFHDPRKLPPDVYWRQGIEIDARQAGRDGVNGMTLDEFNKYR